MSARLARFRRGASAPRWQPVTGRDLADAGIGLSVRGLVGAKIIAAVTGAGVGLVATSAFLGPLPPLALGYAGFVLPSLVIERRAAAARALAERRVVTLVEWLESLLASGRPAESALVALAARPTGAPILDRALREAASAYALGAPLFASVAERAAVVPLPSLALLAADLERARDLGRGTLVSIHDLCEGLRATERARALDAASRVEGSLMLILVLCYLPALMLLVVVPLFLTLLGGLDLV